MILAEAPLCIFLLSHGGLAIGSMLRIWSNKHLLLYGEDGSGVWTLLSSYQIESTQRSRCKKSGNSSRVRMRVRVRVQMPMRVRATVASDSHIQLRYGTMDHGTMGHGTKYHCNTVVTVLYQSPCPATGSPYSTESTDEYFLKPLLI